ncbi:uncharacterized protein LOC105629516 [Jatropha curcas]|uniref:uncharacterized protein LOC105629516 n=1 Tax=Jatropha curcas TaxID=180498 RepID=UPI001895963C|nr:uncharacterized protein LOC105629516 [Jatropha curcas]
MDDGCFWRVDILHALFSERDRKCILQIPLSPSRREDDWLWREEKTGQSSVRSAYKLLMRDFLSLTSADMGRFWSLLWKLKLPAKLDFTMNEFLSNVFNVFSLSDTHNFCFVIWVIWKFRNSVVWQQNNSSAAQDLGAGFEWFHSWQYAQVQKSVPDASVSSEFVIWQRPAVGFVKCNTDALFRPQNEFVGAGWVLRDS